MESNNSVQCFLPSRMMCVLNAHTSAATCPHTGFQLIILGCLDENDAETNTGWLPTLLASGFLGPFSLLIAHFSWAAIMAMQHGVGRD